MSGPDAPPQTLLDVLRGAARRRPGGGVRVFRGADEVERLTHAELLDQAGRISSGLLEAPAEAGGRRIALVFPNSGEFLQAFFGTVAAGAVRSRSRHRSGSRPGSATATGPGSAPPLTGWVLLTTEKLLPILRALVAALGLRTQVRSLAEVRRGLPSWAPVAPDDSALIQYTSGSTAAPRGAVLTHRQVVANLGAIRRVSTCGRRCERELAPAVPRHGAHRVLPRCLERRD